MASSVGPKIETGSRLFILRFASFLFQDPVLVVGDRVEVQVGKDKGKMGVVKQIVEERNWCYVEGLNSEYEYDGATARKKQRPLLITTQVGAFKRSYHL